MPPTAPPLSRKEYIEVLGSMEKGVNYGIAPNLVKNNQLTAAQNLTVRGDFVKPRPPVVKVPMTFLSGADLVTGLFQGACCYEPDSGNASLLAAISGRIFQFTINGGAASVAEKTIPGSPNSSAPTQSWLWQAENYVVINDGINPPIFFDGNTCRRSNGSNPTVLGVTQVNFIAPNIGSLVAITLQAVYNGPLNAVVTIDGASYETQSSTTVNTVILNNQTDVPGNPIPANTPLYIEPARAGFLTADFIIPAGSYATGATLGTFSMSPASNVSVGDLLNLGLASGATQYQAILTNLNDPAGASVGAGSDLVSIQNRVGLLSTTFSYSGGFRTAGQSIGNFLTKANAACQVGDFIYFNGSAAGVKVSAVSNNSVALVAGSSANYGPATYPAGTVVDNALFENSTTVATLSSGFTAPNINGSVTVNITAPYGGAAGAVIYIGNAQYAITAVTPPPTLPLQVQVAAVFGAQVTVTNPGATLTMGSNFDIPNGSLVSENNGQPNTLAVTTNQSAVVPAVNSTVTVNTTTPYTGPSNAVVWIGNASYRISSGAQGPSSNILTVLNLNDTAGNVRGPTGANGPGLVTTIPQLPAGRMGAYGMGRNWMCLTDGRSFVASDIVGGSSGTPALGRRDAPLNITENTYLFEGGAFVIPGSSIGLIRAMCFAATLDASLGQGPLQVFTPTTAFSCNAPVDRATWQSTTNPILTESLISNGALGQCSTQLANGDIVFRSLDGIRSLILARRDFNVWGNVPQSREVQPTMDADNQNLLSFGSAAVFGNRLLLTAQPTASVNGVYHPVTVALNFDPLSTLNTKSPAVYDGLWTPFNVLQYVTGIFNGVQRCFAFVLNTASTPGVIELWEVLSDASTVTQDNNTTPIVMDFTTGNLFDEEAASQNKNRFEYCQLDAGEISVDQVTGPASFAVYFRPDQYPQWTLWNQWSVDGKSTFYPRMGLGTPDPNVFDTTLNRPLREGYTFQIRFVMNNCRLLSARFRALGLPQPEFAPIATSPIP